MSFVYNGTIHGKDKFGITEKEIFGRFKTYNKGNFNHKPDNIWVCDEGYAEGSTYIENSLMSVLYDFLENPNFNDKPTEYVNPEFTHIDSDYIKNLIETIIRESPQLKRTVRKVKDEYINEALNDPYFLESVRLYPEKYLEDYYK